MLLTTVNFEDNIYIYILILKVHSDNVESFDIYLHIMIDMSLFGEVYNETKFISI